MGMNPMYRELKFDAATGKISGLTNLGVADEAKYNFSACLTLFAISLAMDLSGGHSIGRFMSLADGYGAPGYFPGGYDWSGFRDSSPAAIAKMFELAKETLRDKVAKLAEIGLPADLIAAVTVDDNILINEAKKDMRRVRTMVDILVIGQTKEGTVQLSYDKFTKQYLILGQNGSTYQFLGAAGETAKRLAALYTVEVKA